MTEAGRGGFEAALRQRETELIRATRGTTTANTIAPRIDTGAFEDLSPPLVVYPSLLEGNTLVTEPLVARARGPAEIGVGADGSVGEGSK